MTRIYYRVLFLLLTARLLFRLCLFPEMVMLRMALMLALVMMVCLVQLRVNKRTLPKMPLMLLEKLHKLPLMLPKLPPKMREKPPMMRKTWLIMALILPLLMLPKPPLMLLQKLPLI